MTTCESLVRMKTVQGEGDKLPRKVYCDPPEPCGHDAQLYEIRAKKRLRKRGKDDGKQQRFMGIDDWHIQTGSIAVRQHLCDIHKKKAEREGKQLTPIY